MAFKLNTTGSADRNEDRPQRERKEVDYDALNAHVIAAAGTATKPRSIPGVISGIIDLGIQNREPFEGPWNEQDAAKSGAEEFMDGTKRMVRVPQKDVQQLAITIDFPQVVCDKGQFYGDTPSPLPLRILLNGEFGHREDGKWVSTVARGYTVSEVPHDDARKLWGFSKLNTLHKLADAAGILDDNGLFTKERVGELLGKVAQFQFRVYMKPGTGGKSYFTEEIKLQGMIPEGVSVPSYDESILYGINVTSANDPKALKQLRKSIKNTIKRAKNYEGSVIQREFGEEGGSPAPSATAATPPTAEKPKLAAVKTSAPPPPPKAGGTWEDEEAPPF